MIAVAVVADFHCWRYYWCRCCCSRRYYWGLDLYYVDRIEDVVVGADDDDEDEIGDGDDVGDDEGGHVGPIGRDDTVTWHRSRGCSFR